MTVSAVCATPEPAFSGSALATNASFGVARFPRCCAKSGFRLALGAARARFLRFTRETHTIKRTLRLMVFQWKIRFRVPDLAHIALPRRACVCIVSAALATYAFGVVAFPLPWGKGSLWLPLVAYAAASFFAVFRQKRRPIDRFTAEVLQQKFATHTDSTLERLRVKGAKQ